MWYGNTGVNIAALQSLEPLAGSWRDLYLQFRYDQVENKIEYARSCG